MLDYLAVKKTFADKLAADADGIGRFESAFYHTMEYVYHQGVKDGTRATEDAFDHMPPVIHIGIDGRLP